MADDYDGESGDGEGEDDGGEGGGDYDSGDGGYSGYPGGDYVAPQDRNTEDYNTAASNVNLVRMMNPELNREK